VVTRRFVICGLLARLIMPAFAFSQTAHSPTAQTKKKTASTAASARLHHIRRAFVASTDLRPMAQQLLENRTLQAYAGVESYAHKHAAGKTADAGALAWLVVGYAHYLDKDYVQARTAWQHSIGLAPVLGDYLAWFKASAYRAENNSAAVISTLDGFEEKYPDSLHLHEAQMLYGEALLEAGGAARAVAYLEKRRQPYHSDLELLLAKAYQEAGEKTKAAEILRGIYFDAPLAPEAELAEQALRAQGEAPPAGGFDQNQARVELLLKAKRYQQAAGELSPLIERAPTAKLTDLQLDFATALYRSRRREDSRRLFESVSENPSSTTEQKAQALYFLAEIARDQDDRARHTELINQLRTVAPDNSWFQEALLSAGNMYMLRREYDTASRFYAEIYQRQQNSRFSPYAHWKTAWLAYRLGKKQDAERLFEEQLLLYPASNEASAALYWRGRLAEERGEVAIARAYYQKLSENYRYFYYATLGRERLGKIGLTEIADPPLLNKLPAPALPARSWDAPPDNVRAQKAQLLANAAFYDFAVREMLASATGSPAWLAKSVAAIYQEQGSYFHALETMKHAIPGYFSAEIDQLPRPVWETLFPRPYWDDLKRDCLQNQLDPYLVASLIRQESEFNPAAISPKNAMGLMQLLPHVGKNLARELKIRHFSQDQLLSSATNLELGTRYFKHMVDHYDGKIAYALAAYNAGEDRVEDWRKSGDFKDMDEFVESIPFTETREYVQAILRNAALYRLLYPKG
jgi:soluble lytic murein transglycosylase